MRLSSLRRFCLNHSKWNKNKKNGTRSVPSCFRQLSSSSTCTEKAPVALIFDTETTGLVNSKIPWTDPQQPHLVQLGMLLVDTSDWTCKSKTNLLVQLPTKDDGSPLVQMETKAQETHGIAPEDLSRFGVSAEIASVLFYQACQNADVIVAHNMAFDRIVMDATLHRSGIPMFTRKDNDDTETRSSPTGSILEDMLLPGRQFICTKDESTDVLKLPGKFRGQTYKWPTLAEAYQYFTNGKEMEKAHDALADTEACLEVFRALVERDIIKLSNEEQAQDGNNNDKEQGTKDKQRNDIPIEFLKHGDIGTPRTTTSTRATISPQGHNLRTIVPPPSSSTGYLNIDKKDGFLEVTGRGTFAHKDNLRHLGGKWVPISKAWSFDASLAGTVEEYVQRAVSQAQVKQ